MKSRKTTYLDARKKKATAKEKEENNINRSKQQGRNHNNLVILERLISQELVRGVRVRGGVRRQDFGGMCCAVRTNTPSTVRPGRCGIGGFVVCKDIRGNCRAIK